LRIKTEKTADNLVALIFPAEVLQEIGIFGGDEVELTEVGNTLILRPAKNNERTQEVLEKTQEIIQRRKSALTGLSEGQKDE
jgi:antitoxin component of MazEF toxin-antitoxin module